MALGHGAQEGYINVRRVDGRGHLRSSVGDVVFIMIQQMVGVGKRKGLSTSDVPSETFGGFMNG